MNQLESNPVSARLFNNVSLGRMSATEAAETARDIVSVYGHSNEMLSSWASLASGHSQRDLLRWSRSFGLDIDPVVARITHRELRDNTSAIKDHAVLYPHEIIHAVYTRNREQFNKSFLGPGCDENVQAFWDHHSESNWVKMHPAFKDLEIDPSTAIPLGFHSDKGQHIKKDKILTMSWNSVLSVEVTEWSKWLFTILPDDLTVAGVSAEELHAIFVWCMHILLHGVFPERDHAGVPFGARSWRSSMAGKPIAGRGVTTTLHHTKNDPNVFLEWFLTFLFPPKGDYRFVFCELRGDWEWQAETFKWRRMGDET